MRFNVEFEIEVPDNLGVTMAQVEEWAKYMCGYSGALVDGHPLEAESFDPLFGTFEVKRA
jgi:hypothetical protein